MTAKKKPAAGGAAGQRRKSDKEGQITSNTGFGEAAAVVSLAQQVGRRFIVWLLSPHQRKLPVRRQADGTWLNIDATKPSNWRTYEECAREAQHRGAAGVGVALGDLGDGRHLVGVDLDSCRDPQSGEFRAEASAIVAEIGTYTEISPSKAGAKAFGFTTQIPPDGTRSEFPGPWVATTPKPAEAGLYRKGRWFAVTGEHIEGTPAKLCDITEAFNAIHKRLVAGLESEAAGGPSPIVRVSVPTKRPTIDIDALKISELAKEAIKLGLGPGIPVEGEAFNQSVHHWPSRNEGVFFVACELVRGGHSDAEIAAVLLDVGAFENSRRGRTIRDHVHDNGAYPKARLRYAQRQIERARQAVAKSATQPSNVVPLRVVPSADARIAGRRRIHYSENALPRVLDEAEAVLIERDVALYQQLGRLVRVAKLDVVEKECGIRRPAGVLVIKETDPRWTRDQMQRAIDFWKYNDKGKEVPAVLKLDDVRQYHARAGEWKVRPLSGIVLCPTMVDLDGSIAVRDGYSATHRLIVDCQGAVFPPIPERPSEAQARVALEELKAPLQHFPFEGDGSRSVALAAMLTAVSRRAFSSSPLMLFSAPTPGTGKTLLADTAALLATGKKPTTFTLTGNSEEDEKRLSSILMTGDPVILIDNVSVPIQGDLLCAATTGQVQARLLGKSKMVPLDSGALMLASGNNIQVKGDMTRRTLECRLDSKEEHPEKRELSTPDYYARIKRERPQLVVAALTILRWYAQKGRPKPKDFEAMGNFEDWSVLICGALVSLGEDDPRKTRERIVRGDDKQTALVELIDAWESEIGSVGTNCEPGDKALTAKLLIERVQPKYLDDQSNLWRLIRAACANALGRSDVSPPRLGLYLHNVHDRPCTLLRDDKPYGVFRIRQSGGANRAKTFWLQRIGPTSDAAPSTQPDAPPSTPKGEDQLPF